MSRLELEAQQALQALVVSQTDNPPVVVFRDTARTRKLLRMNDQTLEEV